ncbi:ABC-F family ATP-binding cassette domain-containing protein [Marinilactibacillus sp. Marseille-P9653]|uniref:ABC-F family ATP-binding cassette domain-containing protein n=1 Tax=Marinilactibacillus sp. Marseille-P9653 TaxID=2866583 RepID=UPI001CE4A26D|nr:ABC-F family ATP-binding cassette domain-containing protein [Marinilactibacillus sp. Marseille-P9653]
MKELKIENLTHSYGMKTLFDSIDFSITDGQRIGLIGVNGTGKTSLLNILTRQLSPDKGEISKPNDYTIGYLEQKNTLDETKTVLDTVFDGTNAIMSAVRDYESALQQLTNDPTDERAQNHFASAEQKMNSADAWNASASAKSILTRLGITDMQSIVGQLSGGQQKRVALAQVLIQEPDLLILDEPTNHLDFEMIQWLENFLMSYKGALLLVTHDRYFLDHVVNHMVELTHGRLERYVGNYQEYVRLKAEREETQADKTHKQKQLYKQELAWMRAGVKARGTKQQARIDRFTDLKKEVSNTDSNGSLDLNLSGSRLGKKVLELENASFKRDDLVILDEFNLLIQQTDRIGITGENGSGKTTFLNILANQIPLDSGIFEVGETVKIAYYTQTNESMDENKRVISYLQEVAEEVRLADGTSVSVTQLLERFLFDRSSHGTMIGRLSGGEKRRLYLLKLLMQQPNVLLLDEPTNDLDIQTLTVLEEYIQTFSGAVIAVSHDRYFLDKMATKLLVFNGNGSISEYYGKMTEFLEEKNQETNTASTKIKNQNNPPVQKSSDKKEKTKLSYMEKKEWDTIEDEIAKLEEELEEIQSEMNQAGSDYGVIGELTRRQENLEQKLEVKMERWEYLTEFI